MCACVILTRFSAPYTIGFLALLLLEIESNNKGTDNDVGIIS